jgi:hypothetical protein
MEFKNTDLNLTILQEECSEVISECNDIIQIICKIKRFGFDSCHPDNPLHDNMDRLLSELGDMKAMMDILCDDPALPIITRETIDLMSEEKIKKLEEWYDT